MRITMIVTNSVWYDPRVCRTATSANMAGFETTVLGMKDNEYNEKEVARLPFRTVLLDGMDKKYYRANRTLFTKIKREYLRYKRLIKACALLEPDVIHANDLDALPVAYFASRKSKSKIVYDSHEIFTENLSMSKRIILKTFYRLLESMLLKRVDHVVSVSHSSAAILAKRYRIKFPTVVTNCAFKVDEERLLLKRNDIFEVLYHGRFYEGRGYEAFVRAAALLKQYEDIRFVLRGYGSIEAQLREIASELYLDKKLRFDPPVLVTELTVAASSSHLGVVLTEPININFINTVSNKLFEYLNAGLPVILSDLPEHRYLNEKYGFGLIIGTVTPEKIAEAILKIYSDKPLYQELCRKAKLASELLNWDTEVQKLFRIYKKLVKESN
ncbi:MAG: glycosyltransferase [Bacteroidales bacterium]|nr:glycosyltransferase [Bacteroidales bacterium]